MTRPALKNLISTVFAVLCLLLALPAFAPASEPSLFSKVVDRAYHGTYSPEANARHESFVTQELGAVAKPRGKPEVYYLSGAFGAGKSSVVKELQRLGYFSPNEFVIIDIDEIRKELPQYRELAETNPQALAQATQKEAGYLAEFLMWQAIEEGKSILIDSSLQNVDVLRRSLALIEKWAPDYHFRISRLHVHTDLNVALERVAERNRADRRHTDPAKVRASYFAIESRFDESSELFHYTAVIENSGAVPKVIYTENRSELGWFRQGANFPLSALASAEVANCQGAPLRNCLWQTSQRRPLNRGYDVILDLDWTLFYTIKDPSTVNPRDLIIYEGEKGPEYYRASDHAAWFVENLVKLPGVRVHFFTGGPAARSEVLLSKLVFSDGKTTAWDVKSGAFAREHLTPVSDDSNLRMFERMKKMIQRLLPEVDMTRTVLLDDLPGFARYGLQALPSYGRLSFHETFEPSLAGQQYEAKSPEEFQRERDKLVLAFGIIKEAYDRDRAPESKERFAEVIDSIARDPLTGEWHDLLHPKFQHYFNRSPRFCRNLLAP